jgi:amino acid adenylation domain-containing protein
VNVLPLRFRLHPGATVGHHVRTVADTMLDGLEHQRAASSEILRHLDRPRDPGRPALIQVAFGMGRSQRRPEFAGLETTLQVVPRVSETFELYVYATHDDSGVEVSWSYNEALFDRATIELWQRCFVTLVTEMTGALDRPIATLEVLSLADRAQVLELARGPVVERLGHVPVHRALARQVELQPDRVAVIDSRGVHSYRELDERANRFAHLLRALGVAGGSLVAVCLDRSVDLVAALVGVWRSGSGYVPLDPDHPEERLRRILEDCRPPLVLTSRSLVGRLPEGFRTVCIEDEAEQLGRQPTTPPELASQPSDSAYVIFTSGSTGRPKGVEISQGALENFILSMQKEPGFGRDDSILALTTVGFDISALELFLPLATGGRVLIASQQQAKDPKQIQRLLVEGRVTVMQATPATWQMTFDSGWRGNPHLKALCGGETLSGHLAAALLGSTGEVWNVYGPTETTVWSTAQRVTDASDVSIGRPIDNTTLYVLDEHGALLPPGVHGELWIGGAGVAKGYLGRGDLTRERFVPSPFAASDRLYRTGDVARLRRDGRFECLGRVDHQVKIRGFRIELGEVETALLAQPGVSACAVMARESETGNKTLVGYVVPRRDAQIEVGRLREQLARTLPAYMVPPMYVVLDALPLTPSGKVDRKALPAPEPAHDENGALTESPKDAVEERVLAAWHELLGHRGVLLTDNFYASGGDSLMAVRLVEKLNREFETDLSVSELLAHPTVRALGDRIRGCCTSAEPEQSQAPAASRSDTHHGLFCIQQGRAGGLPLFLIHGDRSDGLLPPHLSPATEIWGYHHQGANGERILLETVESLAQHCHREWLEHHGDRPCVLAGHSFGALVAYHIAVLREQAGLTTPRLILIDARHPAILPSRSVSFTPRALKRRLNELLRQRDAEKSRALAEAHLARGELVPVELRRDYTLGTYRLAFMRYQPPQYRGQLEVIRSEEWTRLSPSDYWERSAVGHIRRFVIPGTHLSIIREPEGVVFVAERMRSLLDEVSEER